MAAVRPPPISTRRAGWCRTSGWRTEAAPCANRGGRLCGRILMGDDMAFACTIPAVATVQQDDETIRITRWDFEPGAVTGWHSHGWPYFVVMLVAGTLRIHDGAKETDVPLAQGQAY